MNKQSPENSRPSRGAGNDARTGHWRPALMALAALLLALAGAGDAAAAVARYADAMDYPEVGAGWEAFGDLERRLEHDFDQICGDTFCEGDYSDYQPLRLRCSVNVASGVMKRCLWTFAASEIAADPATGRLRVDTRTWSCPIALPVGLTLPGFMTALAGPSPLFDPLPQGGTPLYENLIDCL